MKRSKKVKTDASPVIFLNICFVQELRCAKIRTKKAQTDIQATLNFEIAIKVYMIFYSYLILQHHLQLLKYV